ncbi:MAG: hypothetical protein HC840_00180 [Leptolyngbyaceae cyanobacterium RM2_2_4]|nr:hypothetical protein [Leptolyngbyaceae cyanobacterium RM2_2_4]
MIEQLQSLMKALEAGSYNAAPGQLAQGAALMVEDLSPVMQNVTFDDSHIKLQKMLPSKDVKSQLHQFNRQLDYGIFGGSAQFEGGIGEEDTSNYVRAVVPMAYYSTTRRVTVAANLIGAFDGVKAEDRAAADAAMKLAGDIEFDLFRGQSDFSNAGVFDGNPLAVAKVPNMIGVDQQVRQSDAQSNTQDLMFAEFGSDQTVVLSAGGTLTQSIIEDSSVRSAMNMGAADRLVLDPISLSAYNKIAHAKERIMLAGSAQEATGAHLRTQWTSSAIVSLEASRFLSGKTRPARARAGSPAAPTFSFADTGAAGSLLAAATYAYYVTAVNMRGESQPSAAAAVAVAAAGNKVSGTITAVAGAQYYNVYRSDAGGSAASAKFIGRVSQGAGNPAFTDLGNRQPGSVTGFLIQGNTMGIAQLAPYSKLKLAVNDLSLPEAHFRFLSLAMYQPRKNVLIENITGQLS